MRRENMTVNAIKTNDHGHNEHALPKYNYNATAGLYRDRHVWADFQLIAGRLR
jgi:hypothetical protein